MKRKINTTKLHVDKLPRWDEIGTVGEQRVKMISFENKRKECVLSNK
jgi:hypothetical protein